jgi:hypothetical protein
MSRFVLSKSTLQIDLPWPSRYEWNREATFQAGGDSVLFIKIATGGLNGAEPSPILALESDGKVFVDQTIKY